MMRCGGGARKAFGFSKNIARMYRRGYTLSAFLSIIKQPFTLLLAGECFTLQCHAAARCRASPSTRWVGMACTCRADARVVAFYAACEQHALHTSLWTGDSTIAGIRLAAMSR
jgi:hypothetical protein